MQAPSRQQPALTMAWGDRFIPLTLWATPYYFKAEVELKQEEIWEVMSQPIRFYQNDRSFLIPGLQVKGTFKGQDWPLTLEDTTGAFAIFSPAPETGWEGSYQGSPERSEVAGPEGQRGYKLGWNSQLTLVDDLKPGDKLIFSTPPGKSGGIVITGVTIKVYNPWAEFPPRYYLPPVYYAGDDLSSWQLVKLARHPRMVLRYHDKDPVALKVRAMYADNPKYELIPIPLFRTDSRYLSDADYVVPSSEVTRTDTLVDGRVIDPYAVQDLIMEPQLGWALAWGKADITLSGNYVRQEEFLAGADQPLRLMRTGQPLPVLQALVTVAPPHGPVHQYLIDGQKPATWTPFARPFEENVSIYFEDIIFQEKDGKPRRLAQPFAMYVFGPRKR